MWMIVLGFGCATLLLAWLLFGYAVWLRFAGDARRRLEPDLPSSFPTVSIVVPCLNEEDCIAEKYRDLKRSEYPADRSEIVFADGGSDDRTVELLEGLTRHEDRARVVRCPSAGKIHQINHVLPMLSGDLVVITDADARLAPDALKWLAAEFEAKPEVAVVGAYTAPRGGLAVERCYWAAQNRIRLLESSVSHVSMVVACCYAFRRKVLSRFPDDVVADDVYVTAWANTLGYQTAYCPKAVVEELRTPQTLPEFFRHKFRKSNAVLREMLRFAYRLPDTTTRWKSILATRLVQQLLLPWATALWIALAATLANFGQFDLPALGAALLLASLLATRKATMAVDLPGRLERFGPVTVCLAYVYTITVLCATALSYLSFRQSSCYARLDDASRKGAREPLKGRRRRAAEKPVAVPPVGRVRVALGGSE